MRIEKRNELEGLVGIMPTFEQECCKSNLHAGIQFSGHKLIATFY
jgi:hypothetical protein